MPILKPPRELLTVQSIYLLLTSSWPLLNFETYVGVTNSNAEVWLVRSAAAIIFTVAICILIQLFVKRFAGPVIILSVASAITMAIVDFYIVAHGGELAPHIIDGFIHIGFLAFWSIYLSQFMLNRNIE